MNKSLILIICFTISVSAKAEIDRYYLQDFDLCGFKSIYISNNLNSISVITLDPVRIVDAVKGSYIGKNYGKIESIENNQIKITETVFTDDGKWVKKKAQITVNGKGDITSCLSN